jgi:hypothetical protein
MQALIQALMQAFFHFARGRQIVDEVNIDCRLRASYR